MHLEPLGDRVLVSLVSRDAGALWIPEQVEYGRRARVVRSGLKDIAVDDLVLIAYRQATVVGSELLVSRGAILAKLEAA